ncbi:hypothetical protein ACIBK8_09935 [Streptomyces sp. NPDC050161]|uniref:hypothetical protein n=1 Tax=Streptomyces sp. NPDC050161 TaxID=3365604 RepID=UPI0037A906B2
MDTNQTPPAPGEGRRYDGCADIAAAFGLFIVDMFVGAFALLMAVGATDYNIFEPDRNKNIDWTIPIVTLCVLAGLCWLSAWPLLRKRFFAGGWVQILFGAGLLLLWAAETMLP